MAEKFKDWSAKAPMSIVDKDDPTRYIFPAGQAAPGASFAPSTAAPVPTVDEINTQLAAPVQAATTEISERAPAASIEDRYDLPAQSSPAQSGMTTSSDPNYFMQAYNLETSAAKKAGNMEQGAFDKIAGNDQEYLNQVNEVKKREQAAQLKFDDEYSKLKADVDSKKIDSSRWWRDKSTGNKVLTMVGMALSSLSPDSFKNAMNAIDKTIERDINDQKSDIELGRMKLQDSKSLYAENLRRFGDERVALASSRLVNSEMIKNKLQGQLAGLKGDVAKANGMKFLGQIDMYQEKQRAEIAKHLSAQAKESRGLMVAGFEGKAPSEVDARALRDMSAQSKSTLDSLKQLEDITKTPFKSLSPSLRTRGAQLSQDIQLSLKEIKKLGVLSGDDSKRLDDYIQNPTDFFSSDKNSLTRIQGAKDLITKAMKYKAESLGMRSVADSVTSFQAY